MHVAARTPDEYLAALPPDRRAVVAALRRLVLAHLPDGFEEAVNWGMLVYQVPRAVFPDTYNGHPLCAVGLAAQKRHYAVYLMGVYGDAASERALREGFAKAGKRLDMGKSCVRFTTLEDVPLEVIGAAVARHPVEDFIAAHAQAHGGKRVAVARGAKAGRAARGDKAATGAAVARPATGAKARPAGGRRAAGTTVTDAKAGTRARAATAAKAPRKRGRS